MAVDMRILFEKLLLTGYSKCRVSNIHFDTWDQRLRSMLRSNKHIKFIYDTWSYPAVSHLLSRELKGQGIKVLDLGCGKRNIFTGIDIAEKPSFSLGIDMDETRLLESRRLGIHDAYVRGDIRAIELAPKSFDIALALDVIEHLSKEDGFCVIEKMERIAKHKVIIVTPNGFEHIRGDKLCQVHKCGWEFNEFKDIGYEVRGLWGLKLLRPMRNYTFLWPLWVIISGITQKLTYFFPALAGALFAVKKLD